MTTVDDKDHIQTDPFNNTLKDEYPIDDHNGFCKHCNSKVTVAQSGKEYGHRQSCRHSILIGEAPDRGKNARQYLYCERDVFEELQPLDKFSGYELQKRGVHPSKALEYGVIKRVPGENDGNTRSAWTLTEWAREQL